MKLHHLEQRPVAFHDVKDQLKQSVYSRSMEAFARGDRARDEVRSIRELEERKEQLRDALIRSLGGLPPRDTPLQPEVTGVLQCDGFTVEKVIFQSRPAVYVTSNLYIPNGITAPRGAVLFLCGHHDAAKHVAEYQIVCRYLAKSGLIVFAVDPLGQGERYSYFEPASGQAMIECGVGEHGYAGTQSWFLGDSIARYFVHDAMRAVDYLCSRPEVDPNLIGVTGNSGGGTQTSLMMMCDTRIAAAAPGTFIMDRRSFMWTGQPQDAEQIWPGMTAAGFDHEDILLAMVPRPVLVLAASYDFFPIEGTRRTVERVQRFWEMYGQPERLEWFEDPEVHKYSVRMAKRAARFFATHLLSGADAAEPDDGGVQPLEASRMWCTRSGQVRAEFAHARAVYEENVDRLAMRKAERSAAQEGERKKRALAWLREQVESARAKADPNPRFIPLGHVYELPVQSLLWWSEDQLYSHGLLFGHSGDSAGEQPLTVALWNNGTRDIRPYFSWLQAVCAGGGAVLVLDVRGEGALAPHPVNPYDPKGALGTLYKFATDLFWLGDSLAAARVFDVLRAIDLACGLPGVTGSRLSVYARGRSGIYALLAAALDSRIRRLEWEDRIDNVEDWVQTRFFDEHDMAGFILPGMLNYFDLPDLRQWIGGDLL